MRVDLFIVIGVHLLVIVAVVVTIRSHVVPVVRVCARFAVADKQRLQELCAQEIDGRHCVRLQ